MGNPHAGNDERSPGSVVTSSDVYEVYMNEEGEERDVIEPYEDGRVSQKREKRDCVYVYTLLQL